MRSVRRVTTRTAAVVAGGLLLAGCSVSASIGEGELESNLEEQIASTNPDVSVESVDCADGLEGEVDATADCTVVIDGAEYPVAITVTEVDGENVNFDYEITEG